METTRDHLAPFVRATIQEAFDEFARIVGDILGEKVKPRPVSIGVVFQTISAMQSLCRRRILTTAQAPFWLDKCRDWDPDDLLIFNNLIVNVRRYIAGGKDHAIARTPRLFYHNQTQFDFSTDPAEPVEWHKFLESLEQSEEWYEFLQQIMGYCLLLSYDLQKFFIFCGPPRSGKGTITKVLENLLGGEAAVCSPNLENFASSFGLEQAIAKRLAVVSEIELPKKNRSQIIGKVKAITGGDLVSVNRKNIKELPLRLKMKIIMVTNNFVALPDNSGALQARMLPLKLTKSFVGKEDLELGEKLKAECPGILIWALEGLRKLLDNQGKFTLPESTQVELDQLLTDSAPLQSFVAQCCQVDLKKAVQTVALYDIYKQWHKTDNADVEPLSSLEFANELRTTLPTITKSRASKPNPAKHKGCQVIETEFDGHSSRRPNLWVGICPKPEWRGRGTVNPLV